MEALQTWWDIAQVAGAGAAVVLGPVCYMLWRRVNSDTDYIRQSDRNTLEVLNELTKVLEKTGLDDENRHKELSTLVEKLTNDVKVHVSDALRRQNGN